MLLLILSIARGRIFPVCAENPHYDPRLLSAESSVMQPFGRAALLRNAATPENLAYRWKYPSASGREEIRDDRAFATAASEWE